MKNGETAEIEENALGALMKQWGARVDSIATRVAAVSANYRLGLDKLRANAAPARARVLDSWRSSRTELLKQRRNLMHLWDKAETTIKNFSKKHRMQRADSSPNAVPPVVEGPSVEPIHDSAVAPITGSPSKAPTTPPASEPTFLRP